MGDAGASALAQLLEKNNTIKTYNIQCWYLMHTTAKPKIPELFMGFGGCFNRERNYGCRRAGTGTEPQDQQHTGALVSACKRSRRRRRDCHGNGARSQPRSHRTHALAERAQRPCIRCIREHAQEQHDSPEPLAHAFVFDSTQCFPQKLLNKRSLPDTENNGTAEGAAAFASGLFVNHTLKSLFLHSLSTTQPPPNF